MQLYRINATTNVDQLLRSNDSHETSTMVVASTSHLFVQSFVPLLCPRPGKGAKIIKWAAVSVCPPERVTKAQKLPKLLHTNYPWKRKYCKS